MYVGGPAAAFRYASPHKEAGAVRTRRSHCVSAGVALRNCESAILPKMLSAIAPQAWRLCRRCRFRCRACTLQQLPPSACGSQISRNRSRARPTFDHARNPSHRKSLRSSAWVPNHPSRRPRPLSRQRPLRRQSTSHRPGLGVRRSTRCQSTPFSSSALPSSSEVMRSSRSSRWRRRSHADAAKTRAPTRAGRNDARRGARASVQTRARRR